MTAKHESIALARRTDVHRRIGISLFDRDIATYACSDFGELRQSQYSPHHWDGDTLNRGCTRPPSIPHRFEWMAHGYTRRRSRHDRSARRWYVESEQWFTWWVVSKGEAHASRIAGLRERLP